MKHLDRKIKPSPWMCFRTWIAPNGEARSMLCDERQHKLAILEGPSSILWLTIESECTWQDLERKAFELDVKEELEDFIESLSEQEFIEIENYSIHQESIANPAPKPRLLEDADNAKVEQETMEWVARNGFLFSVHWEITYRCNERCVHCYNPGAAHTPHEKPERETNELNLSEAISLLDDLKEAGVFRLVLSGGEVLLKKDIWKIFEEAKSRGFSLNIYTNGLKLDLDACNRLAKIWPSSVSISIYSADPDTHDSITNVPGSFDRSVNALTTLNNLGIKTFLKSTQMGHTLGGYQKVHDLALSIGAGPEIDMHMSAAVDGASAPLALAAKNPEELVVLAATYGSPLFVGNAENNWGHISKDPNATVCGAAVGSMGIDPTGGINTCNSMPLPSGSHREHGFINIWKASRQYRKAHTSYEPPQKNIEEAASLLSQWQGITLKDFHECGTHRRCGWCTKCPGLAMLEHGDPLAPSTTNCRLATARMTAADLLAQGISRENIALRLGVPLDFGKRASISLPIINEEKRGTDFNPTTIAEKALGCGTKSPITRSSFRNKQGLTTLHSGSEATLKALSSFEGIFERALG